MSDREPASPIALDTTCFIFGMEQPDSRAGKRVREIWASSERLATSTLTLAELMVGRLKSGGRDDAENARSALASWPGLTLVAVDEAVAALAATVRTGSGLKLPDAIQVATALHVGARLLVTADQQFRRAESFISIEYLAV
jgi:predicted nucleic acid-binding protein